MRMQTASAWSCSLDYCTGPKWILQPNSRSFEVCHVPRHDRKIVHQSDGCDLLVEFMLWVGDSQATPYLRHVSIEGQDVFPELLQDIRQPRLEQFRLITVAAMAYTFDATAEFADRDRRHVHRLPRGKHTCEKTDAARICVRSLPGLANNVGINQIHSAHARLIAR